MFVLNPKRSPEVTHILSKPKNIKNLVAFLSTFKDKFKDSHFGSNESGAGYELFQSELKNVIESVKSLEKRDEIAASDRKNQARLVLLENQFNDDPNF